MKNRFDIDYVSDYYAKAYGMHRNEIASYYIIGLPIAIERFISNKKIYNIIFILLILSAIGIVFSRGAYLSTMIAILGYLVISKRLKLFPVITIIIIAIPLIIYTPVLTRASQGIKTKDRDAISAGRIDDIWLPLIKEYAKSPKKMIFGSGRYAIHSSNAASKGEILQDISHPHNMFLEIIIDAGLIGFTVIALFYFRVIYKAFRTLSIMKDDRLKAYLYANIISIICFLISGFTDRSFFPKDDTMFIWVILACAIVNCTIAENIVSIQHQVNVSTNSKA
jgi:O-antigen ligase